MMKLPVGFGAGSYEVRLVDSSLTLRAAATGTATMEDFGTTLRATMDLGSVPRGRYQLVTRSGSDEWQLSPAAVR